MAKKETKLIWFVVAIILTTTVFIYHLLYADFSFTVLSSSHPVSALSGHALDKEIIKGEYMRGQFIATDNNLGIVAVRFRTFARENDDILRFRLKQQGVQNFLVDTTYRSTFSDNDLYNFGLPAIADSAGKTYEFEIVSTRGRQGNAVAVAATEPVLVTKYKFPKGQLLHSPTVFAHFFLKKIGQTVTTPDALFSFFILYLPVAYVLAKRRGKRAFVVVAAILIAADIFLFKTQSWDWVVAMMIFLLLVTTKKNRHIQLWVGGMILLLLMALLLGLRQEQYAEKAASWAFIVYALMAFTLTNKKGMF